MVTGLFFPIQVWFTPFPIPIFPFPSDIWESINCMKRKVNEHIFHWLSHRLSGDILRMSELQLPGCSLSRTQAFRTLVPSLWPAPEGRALAVNISQLETEQTSQGWRKGKIPKNIWITTPKVLITFLVGLVFFHTAFFLLMDWFGNWEMVRNSRSKS